MVIEINMTPTATFAPVIINLSQFDRYFDHFYFLVKETDGKYHSFSSDSVLTLTAVRPDKEVVRVSGAVQDWEKAGDGCFAWFPIDEKLTEIAGDVICEVTDKGKQRAARQSTANFIIRVEPSPLTARGIADDGSSGGDDTPSGDETRFLIYATHDPYKTVYEEGETLDLTGAEIVLVEYMVNNPDVVVSRKIVTSDCTFSPAHGDVLTAADSIINIRYKGGLIPDKFHITVNAKQINYRLVIDTLPNKTEYTEGETLDLTGIKVVFEGYNDNGVQSSLDVTNSCTFEPVTHGSVLSINDTLVTAKYEVAE